LKSAARAATLTPMAVLLTQESLGGPSYDVTLGTVLLRHGLGDSTDILRVYSPEPTAAFSRRDRLRPGFARAVRAARDHGFEPVIRSAGGRLAAYHSGGVVVEHVHRRADPQLGIGARFEEYATLIANLLTGFGLDARIGEVPGEYCPGPFSVNAAGTTKIVGSAQRVTREGWLFSSVIQVVGSASLAAVLTDASAALGYDFDPGSVGSVEDFVPGVTAADVARAVRERYLGPIAALSELPMETMALVQQGAPEHRV
jgi:octanoyl-[GcvH]:protein N-octanoyltransferase